MVLVEIGKAIIQQDGRFKVVRYVKSQRADRRIHRSSTSSVGLVDTVLSPLVYWISAAVLIRTLERRRGVVAWYGGIGITEHRVILEVMAVGIIDRYFLYLKVMDN